MRRVLQFVVGGSSLLILLLGGAALHLWTTYLSYRTFGFVATVGTLVFPPLGEVAWFVLLWREVGVANWYTVSLAVYALAIVGLLWSDHLGQGKPTQMTPAEEMRAIRPK